MKKKTNFSAEKSGPFLWRKQFNMNYINFGQFRCDIHSVAQLKKKKCECVRF